MTLERKILEFKLATVDKVSSIYEKVAMHLATFSTLIFATVKKVAKFLAIMKSG